MFCVLPIPQLLKGLWAPGSSHQQGRDWAYPDEPSVDLRAAGSVCSPQTAADTQKHVHGSLATPGHGG